MMKANVYVLKRDGKWEARMTIAPEVDQAYWFGEGGSVLEAGKAWLWTERLPLGQACQVAELWNEAGMGRSAMRLGEWILQKRRVWLHTSWDEGRVEAGGATRAGTRETEGEASGGKAGIVARITGAGTSGLAELAETRYTVGRSSEEAIGMAVRETARSRRHGAAAYASDAGLEPDDRKALQRLERLIMQCSDDAGRSSERRPTRGLLSRAERWAPGCGGRLDRGAAAMAKLAAVLLQGRALLSGEARALLVGAAGPGADESWSAAFQLVALLGQARLGGAVAARQGRRADARRKLRCLRCGSGETQLKRTPCHSCGRVCAYCEACLLMGRSRECELLIQGRYETPLEGRIIPAEYKQAAGAVKQLQRWGLSPAQQSAAAEALRFVERKLGDLSQGRSPGARDNRFLLWAVTGAGKTEMIFPLVQTVLEKGGRALIASPRRDVVIELDPRIRKAFPEAEVVTLYGGSEQRWERGHITLSTTHQLLRFHQSFDLVIIDEIDAFPYLSIGTQFSYT